MKLIIIISIILCSFSFFGKNFSGQTISEKRQSGIHKVNNVIIYKDTCFFSDFPSVIKCPDRKLIVAFRRTPDRRIFGRRRNVHVDPNSYAVNFHSKDVEEIGILRTTHYVENPLCDLDKIRVLINFDIAGTGIKVVNGSV